MLCYHQQEPSDVCNFYSTYIVLTNTCILNNLNIDEKHSLLFAKSSDVHNAQTKFVFNCYQSSDVHNTQTTFVFNCYQHCYTTERTRQLVFKICKSIHMSAW